MTEPYTAADILLVAQVAHDANCGCGIALDRDEDMAQAILSALAEAGRLAPDGAERRWGVKGVNGSGFMQGSEYLMEYETEGEARAEFAEDAEFHERDQMKIVWRALGPWVEADEDGTT